jgi:hypothetical protein
MHRLRLPTVAAACASLTISLVPVGCAREDTRVAEMRCVEARLSAGTAYRFDPATAIAVSRAIAYSHPRLDRIVDLVAEHQQRAPETEMVTTVDPRDSPAEVSLTYIMALTNLAARPDLANPRTLDVLEQAAVGSAGDPDRARGIGGVYVLLTDDQRVFETGDRAVAELSTLIDRQTDAIEDAGIVDLPWVGCLSE